MNGYVIHFDRILVLVVVILLGAVLLHLSGIRVETKYPHLPWMWLSAGGGMLVGIVIGRTASGGPPPTQGGGVHGGQTPTP